ncbi:hypothetical protein [Deinococcus sp. KSM4-11]|uniref:hypothetical protein n=1 Tax=Deinococcus sp. KSM4-11 TaxID=2568654 RepID=UPI001454D4B5|nr:hypothetical protein [Deinococcus sp. KSM4-11]
MNRTQLQSATSMTASRHPTPFHVLKLGLTGLLLSCAPTLAQTPAAAPAAGPYPALVACEAGQDRPCVVLASQASDITGVWKQYQHNPAFAPSNSMGFIRYAADGTFVLSSTVAGTAQPAAPFPHGTYSFSGSRLTMNVQGVPPSMPECALAVYEVRVLRLGSRPVALQYTPVQDTCKPRLADLSYDLPYVGP